MYHSFFLKIKLRIIKLFIRSNRDDLSIKHNKFIKYKTPLLERAEEEIAFYVHLPYSFAKQIYELRANIQLSHLSNTNFSAIYNRLFLYQSM